MDVKGKLRVALGTLRDHAALGKAVISASGGHPTPSAAMELALLRSTDRSDAPVDDNYVHEILFLVANAPGSGAASLARKLSRRLESATHPLVALKTLLLLHRLIRAGDRRFELDLRGLHASGDLRLQPPTRWSSTEPATRPSAPASFLPGYAAFLQERMGWVINPAGKLEPVLRPSSSGSETALRRLARCQTLLDRAISCLPQDLVFSGADRVTRSALTIVLRESFRVYASFAEGFEEAVMGLGSSLRYHHAQRRKRDLAERAASQTQRLLYFYEDCKRMVVGKGLDYPRVRVVTVDDLAAMDGILLACSGAALPSCSGSKGLAVGRCEEVPTTTVFSCRLETRISTEWVAFDEQEGSQSQSSSFSAGATEDCSVGSANYLPLSWESFEDR